MVRSLQIGIRREIHRRVAGRIGKCGTLTADWNKMRYTGEMQGAREVWYRIE